jgi:Uma2 family endonuclease
MNAPVRPPVRQPVVLTDAQFEDMTRKGAFVNVGRVELRGGIVTEMSPVHYSHSAIVFGLTQITVTALSGGLRVLNEISVKFGPGFQPTADIVIFDHQALSPDFDGPLPAAAVKLVIEVADASLSDDLGQKLVDYAQAGLAEYWVADVRARVIHQCAEPTVDGYRRRHVIRFGEPAAALTLPLTLDTKAL